MLYQEGSILWSVCWIKKEVNSGVYVGMLDHRGSILRSVCWIMKEVYSGVYVGMLDHRGSILYIYSLEYNFSMIRMQQTERL